MNKLEKCFTISFYLVNILYWSLQYKLHEINNYINNTYTEINSVDVSSLKTTDEIIDYLTKSNELIYMIELKEDIKYYCAGVFIMFLIVFIIMCVFWVRRFMELKRIDKQINYES